MSKSSMSEITTLHRISPVQKNVGSSEIDTFSRVFSPVGRDTGDEFYSLRDAIRILIQMLESNQFSEIDSILESTIAQDLTPEMQVSILRVTYPLRDRLPHWESFLERLRECLILRGYDSERVLRGLRSPD